MAEPWIRVHANLDSKPIVWRAVEALGVKEHEAMGILVQFWGAVSQHATNGHVSAASDAQLEKWAGWRGKRGRFAAFIRGAHLDPDGRVNEWDEYAGKLEGRREQERTRKQRERDRKARAGHADGTQDVTRTSLPTIRNDTKRSDVVDNSAVESVDGSVVGEPALTAIYLTIFANGAIAERWGEQPNPLVPAGAVMLADELQAMSADIAIVRESFYRQARESKQPHPPRGVNYYRQGILDDLERSAARLALKASGERPPPHIARGSKVNPGAQMVANIMGVQRD